MKRKFLAAILMTALLAINTLGFNQHTAHAEWKLEWPKIELPKIELPKIELPKLEWPKFDWPKIEIPKFTIPGTNIVVDPDLGMEGIKKLAESFKLPDEIDIPGTSFKIYTKESIGTNLVKNILPFADGFINYLDPLKPAASAARLILGYARPLIEPLIRSILPAPAKHLFWQIKDQINGLVKSLDIPILKDVLLPLWNILVGPIDDLAMEILDILAEEDKGAAKIGGPGSGTGGGGQVVGGPPQMIIPQPFVNQKPIGAFDAIDENGIATGWAYDPNEPGASLRLKVKIWTRPQPIVTEIVTDQHRPDVNQPGNHGFSFRIPSIARTGEYLSMDFYAIDKNDASIEVELPRNKSFRLVEKAAGRLEKIDKDGTITGWAIDPDRENTSALVKVYLDDTKHLGDLTVSIPRPDLKDLIAQNFNIKSKNNVGFKVKIDPEQYRDGINHKITAYVINENDKGEVTKSELPYALTFMFPETLPVSFEKDPVTVQQGSRVFNTIFGVGNKDHYANVYIDDKKIDINADKHGYPFNNPQTGITIPSDKTGVKTRSMDFSFKTPKDITLGEHTVTVENGPYTGEYQGFVYKGSFKINVIPYEQMTITVPATIAAESEFDIIVSKIPRLVKFSGEGKNASFTGASMSGDKGSYNPTLASITENVDGAYSIRIKLPYEANVMREDSGPIDIILYVSYDTELAREEFRAQEYMNHNYFTGKTAQGAKAIFTPNCKSTLKPALDLQGGTGSASGSATGFGCNQKFSVTISGENEGKAFSFTFPNNSKSPAPINLWGDQTSWNGEIPQFALGTNVFWSRDYTSVEDVTITITDAQGFSASAKVKITSPYQVKILPLKGDKLVPGEDIKLVLQGFTEKISLSLDGESWRQIYLNKENIKTDENGLIYYSGLYMPTWVNPGTHKVTAEDLSYTGVYLGYEDEAKKVRNKAQSSFVIEGEETPEEDDKTDTGTKTDSEKKKKSPPKVTLNITTAKAGDSIDIIATGFSQLATMTIYIRPASSPDEGGTKLSGYADYSDSDGALTKNAKIPSTLSPGSYKIIVTDIEGKEAATDLTIEALPKPKPKPKPTPKPAPKVEVDPTTPTPEPEPTPIPQPDPEPYVQPEPEPEPQSEPEEEKAPTCPDGYSYSPTFKQCLEDAPQSSPYEGLPCDDSIPMYSQKGCIPQ